MISSSLRLLFLACVVMFALSLITGCPDRSNQAPLPDYSNMTDGGGENEQDNEEPE